ncbi:xylan 1,4-beta-xylosidase [Streptomyces sp. M19]
MTPTVRRWRITLASAAGVCALVLALATCGVWPGGRDRPGQGGDGAPTTALGWGSRTPSTARTTAATAPARRSTSRSPRSPCRRSRPSWAGARATPNPRRATTTSAIWTAASPWSARPAAPRAHPVLRPDWMKGGTAGRTNWSQSSLETAPSPDHYRDFAELAGKIAERYPDVRHFVVWNELKGFYDDGRRRWDAEGYTRLYNLVYEELKKRDPANLVGGPYVVADSERPGDPMASSRVHGAWGGLDRRAVDALTYWNQHKAGADFVVVDGASFTRDGRRTLPDEFGATAKFTDVTRWLTELTHLPVWWAEWYVEPRDPDEDGGGDRWSEAHRTAVQAAAMIALARAARTRRSTGTRRRPAPTAPVVCGAAPNWRAAATRCR